MASHFSYHESIDVKVVVCTFTATAMKIRWIWCIASPSQVYLPVCVMEKNT